MKIPRKLIGILYLLFFSSALAENSVILETQFKSDLQVVMLREAPKLGSDISRPKFTEDRIKAALDKIIQKTASKSPNYFSSTTEEEAKLEKHQHIVTKEQLAKSIADLRSIATNPLVPVMLEEYEKIELEDGLNPAQRLLAYRLSQSLLSKAQQTQKALEISSGEQDAAPNHFPAGESDE